MKKILCFILAICLIVPCVALFSSCQEEDVVLSSGAPAVKGKTYEVTGEVRILWDDGLSETLKNLFLQIENNGVEISEKDYIAKIEAIAKGMANKGVTFNFTKNYDDVNHAYTLIVKSSDEVTHTGTYAQNDDKYSVVGYDVGDLLYSGDSQNIMYIGNGEYGLAYKGYRPGDAPAPNMANTNVVIVLKLKQ